jgi:cell division protein FtsI/penicillin-binding protein 2
VTGTTRSGSRARRTGAHRAPRTASSWPRLHHPGTGNGNGSKRATNRVGRSRAGAFRVAVRSRSFLVRAAVLVVGASLVGVGLARPGISSAEPTVGQFLLAWESRHYLAAARLTTGNPRVVAAALASAYQRLDASNVSMSMGTVRQHGTTAQAGFEADVDLSGSGLPWNYTGSFALRDGADGWRIVWNPSVIVPGMTGLEQLAVVSQFYPRAQVLDSGGQSLIVPSQVVQVGVYPGKLADPARTAAALSAVTKIPAAQIEGQIEENLQDDFLELITYTPSQYAQLSTRLSAVPGLEVRQTTEPLVESIAPDIVGQVGTETAAVLRTDGVEYRPGTTVGLSGLESTFQRELVGTPRTDVVLQQSGKAAVDLKTWLGEPGTAVHTTLDSSVQLAADEALADVPTSAAIVAVQTSTGKILAVASQTAGGLPALSPLSGQYEPGQTFTIISSAALLSTGRLAPSDPVPCPASNSVDGTIFTNDPPVQGLGSAPSFQADFSNACATAFAGGLSLSLSPNDLMKAGSAFGIGGWDLPDSPAFAGQIGQPTGEGPLAEDLIGTGDVRVSPLDMALAAGVVQSGRWHSPSLVEGALDPSSASRSVESDQVLAALRDLMQSAMQTPQNRAANVGGDVFGQTGSAQFESGSLRSNWFVGYQGGIAFAVVQLSNPATTANASAIPLTASFLTDLRAGS